MICNKKEREKLQKKTRISSSMKTKHIKFSLATGIFFSIGITLAMRCLSGCASNFTMTVRNATTGEPMEGVCIERHKSIGWFARNFTPVVCIPTRFDSSNRTDNAGSIYFEGNPEREVFYLRMPPDIPWETPMNVKIGKFESKLYMPPSIIQDIRENNDIITEYYIAVLTKQQELFFIPKGRQIYAFDLPELKD